jgi:hypothetical protein
MEIDVCNSPVITREACFKRAPRKSRQRLGAINQDARGKHLPIQQKCSGGIFSHETSLIRLIGSVLMEMREKWMMGQNSFTMERYEADKDKVRNAVQEDCKEQNHTA